MTPTGAVAEGGSDRPKPRGLRRRADQRRRELTHSRPDTRNKGPGRAHREWRWYLDPFLRPFHRCAIRILAGDPNMKAPWARIRMIGILSPSRNAVPAGVDALTNAPSTTGSPAANGQSLRETGWVAPRPALVGIFALPGFVEIRSAIQVRSFRHSRSSRCALPTGQVDGLPQQKAIGMVHASIFTGTSLPRSWP